MKQKLIILFALFFTSVPAFAGAEVNISVPFTSQAPQGNWSEPWQNACEEATIAIVDFFYNDKTFSSLEIAAKEILSIFNQKNALYGTSKDESLNTVIGIIKNLNSNWTARKILNPTIEDIKKEIDAKRPVIFPLYGQMVSNPYYTPPGPNYHMIVVSGYDDASKEFIAQDVGTRHGKNFRFSYDELMAANFDLSKPNYTDGDKAVLFTSPQGLDTVKNQLAEKLAGYILLQVEENGQAWYVDHNTNSRYYLKDGSSAFNALSAFGLGITNEDLNKIPIGSNPEQPDARSSESFNVLTKRLLGRILLQVEENGEAWYVNPNDGRRYYMKNGDAAYQIMRYLSLGITNENLNYIAVHTASPQPR